MLAAGLLPPRTIVVTIWSGTSRRDVRCCWCGANGCGAVTSRCAPGEPGQRPRKRSGVGPALTEQARRWAYERVGRDGQPVELVRVERGVGWNTVMRAVRVYGTSLVDDTDRLDGITGLGVDEHVWQHAGPRRRTGYAAVVVDLTPGGHLGCWRW